MNEDLIPFDHVSRAIYMLGELLGRTWRVSLTGRVDLDPYHDRMQGRIYAFWHSSLLALAWIFRNSGKTALVSESRDGMRAAAVAQRWGHAIIHGSSSHGGLLALRACCRALRAGENVVMTPDGPRGPAGKVKPGVSQIALIAGAPVVPIAVLPSRSVRLGSWDRFIVPLPFCRITVRVGDPIRPQISSREPDPAGHLTRHIQEALDL